MSINEEPDYYATLLKSHILKCQWEKNHKERYAQQEIQAKEKRCEMCWHRFDCHTLTARLFHITETSSVWRAYEIFAEDRQQAQELWNDWEGEVGIATLIDENSDGFDVEVEEEK